MRENDWGAAIDRVLEVSIKLLWPQVIEDLTVAQVLGALLFYFKSPEVIDPKVGLVVEWCH